VRTNRISTESKDSPISKRAIFLRGALSGSGTQIVTIVIGLVSIPIGLAYLGPLNFGLWTTINSIIAYLGLSQFGTGTAAAAMIAKETKDVQKSVILRQAFLLLAKVAFVLISLTGAAALFSHAWSAMFGNVPGAIQQQAVMATIAMGAFYFVRLPTLAFTAAFIGLQEVHFERLYAVVLPVVLSLFALLLTIHLKGGLVMLACLTGAANVMAGLLATLHFVIWHVGLWPRVKTPDAHPDTSRELFVSGRRFFFIGVAAMVVWNTDNLVISFFLGPEAVTAYAVTFKLFAAGYSIFFVVTTALWPMFGDAFGRNDWNWIRNTYRNGLGILSILGGLVWIGGILFAKPIILLWTGNEGYGGYLVVFALGGYGYVLSMVNLHANLLSGLNTTRTLLWVGVAEAVTNLVLSVLFIGWWGIGGVALGTFVSALITVFWLLPQDVSRQTQSQVSMLWRSTVRHLCLAVAPGVLLAFLISEVMSVAWVILIGTLLCLIYVWGSWQMLPLPLRNQMYQLFRAAK
jgi:O-antigen/teichoic acid export membrane protein